MRCLDGIHVCSSRVQDGWRCIVMALCENSQVLSPEACHFHAISTTLSNVKAMGRRWASATILVKTFKLKLGMWEI